MISLVMTTEPARIGWLPQFVRHYLRQGVCRFEISIQFEPGIPKVERDRILEGSRSVLGQMEGVTLRELVCTFDAMSLRAHHDEIQSTISKSCDWIVWADVDEFQIHPYPLPVMTSHWTEKGQSACKGYFIDRVARDGSLCAFDPCRTIWSQFPVGTNMTKVIVQGQTNKVVCARPDVRIKHANHDLIKGQEILWADTQVPVHHFKWDASLRDRLATRLTDSWKERCSWWPQTERLFQAIDSSGGKLPLSNVHCFDYLDDDFDYIQHPYEVNSRYHLASQIPSQLYLNR
ncbi:hypothetical protein NE852_23555 [Rhizobium sp. Pop5]|uniref:hypothetical protein n=1 Tax=Rhizobium sp. Pop5 TaxID=1223565 RepID=UPI000AF95035|nr:hypothetical protein [Rhizobium sp. Pop5]UVD56982.1 hypothetical protein NE852_23555 [Rhizobium sp. Pop5]